MRNLCIHLTDENLIKKIEKVAPKSKNGTPKYKEWATKVFDEYFSNRINQLKAMSIEDLAEYALSLEEKINEG